MTKIRRIRHLLVLVDTFCGWPEAFPCRTNQAQEVVKRLLQEIIPRSGVPLGMSSDRGRSHFIAEIVREASKALGIQWDLHTPWRPQSSRKVERMNTNWLEMSGVKFQMASGFTLGPFKNTGTAEDGYGGKPI